MIELSEAASNAMLNVLGGMMDGGSIELHSDERVLAILKLSDPATQEAVGGELEFNKIAEEDGALAQGNAVSARIVDRTDVLILECSVGDENSDAVIRLNTIKIYRGGPVRLKSFKLAMP